MDNNGIRQCIGQMDYLVQRTSEEMHRFDYEAVLGYLDDLKKEIEAVEDAIRSRDRSKDEKR